MNMKVPKNKVASIAEYFILEPPALAGKVTNEGGKGVIKISNYILVVLMVPNYF